MPNWQPTVNLETLRHRQLLKTMLRSLFDNAGFLEVETPCLSLESVIDAHLDPIGVSFEDRTTAYLQTSPEAHMKRLLSSGAEKIYQFSRAFRAGEVGLKHNPEFSMLEWYAVDWTIDDQIAFITRFIQASLEIISFRSTDLNHHSPMTVTYSDLFQSQTGINPIDTTPNACQKILNDRGLPIPSGMEESPLDDWLNLIWSSLIEPSLQGRGIVFVTHYPASQAALARLSPDDSRVALRFELYLDGLEICNGYDELTDAEELEHRMQVQQSLRIQLGKPTLTPPNLLINAQRAHFPPCTGVALGIDRLLMWLLKANSIQDVIPFPWTRA